MDSKRTSERKTNQEDNENEYEIKHMWLRDQMRIKIPEYTSVEKLKVFCGTWNLNDKVFSTASSSSARKTSSPREVDPSTGRALDLGDWLRVKESTTAFPISSSSANTTSEEVGSDSTTETISQTSTAELDNEVSHVNEDIDSIPDMYIISFQEMVDLTPVNVVMSNQKIIERLNHWKLEIENTINSSSSSSSSSYSLVMEKHLVGILLLVYVQNRYIQRIRDVRGIVLPTGALGIMGNKGAVGVRLDFDLTSICMICSHFHSGRDNVMLRNIDYRHIVEKSIFSPLNLKGDHDHQRAVRPESIARWWYNEWLELEYHLFDHDIIFWLGDLNYRIEEGISTEEVFKAMQAGLWHDYLDKDQLTIERNKRTIFEDFIEGAISFPPTYKYQPGTDIYECRPDKKLRAPAWCDRILYRYVHDQYPDSVRLLEYRRTNLMLSDHKPVSAIFECDIRVSQPQKQREVYQALLRVIDHWENSTTPKVEFPIRHLDFGLVDYLIERTIHIPIKNVGGVFAHWSFVPKLDDTQVCPRWLKFIPMNGVLAPGQEMEITAKVIVDEQLARAFSAGSIESKLEEIVVFRMTRGSDFFITIVAEINGDSVSGMGAKLDDIYDPEASLRYYNDDD